MRTVRIIGPTFYSERDRTTFFTWLEGVDFIGTYRGDGLYLSIEVHSEKVNQDGVVDLRGLLRRYQLDHYIDDFVGFSS